jgi:hypothetical protein
VVHSDDGKLLLESKIEANEPYLKQGGCTRHCPFLILITDQSGRDKFIVWAEVDGDDTETILALSFQDSKGCAQVWEEITEIQKTMADTVEVNTGVYLVGRGSTRRGMAPEKTEQDDGLPKEVEKISINCFRFLP